MVLTGACGGSPSRPSEPVFIAAAGIWRGDIRLTSGTGKPCVGAAFHSAAGITFDYTLRVKQSARQVTAASMSPATGIVCELTGTAGASSVALSLTSCADTLPPRFFNCEGNIFRDALPSGLTVNANISGNSLPGSYAETYDFFESGTSTKLGTATLNAQLTLSRQ